MTEFQLDGKFQQISIDPTAHVELGQDVTLRSFVCLEVGNGATLKLGNRVFFNINCSIHCGYPVSYTHLMPLVMWAILSFVTARSCQKTGSLSWRSQ